MTCAQSKDGTCLNLLQGFGPCTPEELDSVCRVQPHRCQTACDPDCDAPCHEAHAVRWRREHDPVLTHRQPFPLPIARSGIIPPDAPEAEQEENLP